MAERQLKSVTFEGLPWKYIVPTQEKCIDLGEAEDGDVFAVIDTLVEDGNYKISDGDFYYTIKIERPAANIVGQTYWSTEEGVENTCVRTGWLNEDGETWSFGDWDTPLYSSMATDSFAAKAHDHYSILATESFEEWISKYISGDNYVRDRTTQRFYYVKQYGYSAQLNGLLRRYQTYFEITEPWKVYSRAGSAVPGNSSNITWGEWHCVYDLLPSAITDAEIDEICGTTLG